MVIIQNYRMKYNTKTGRFHVKNTEVAVCPVCSKKLKVIGSRKRGIIKYNGKKIPLQIRRLKCEDCNEIHHELPDIIVPYKRYSTPTIEKILLDKNSIKDDCLCEISTISRMKSWFNAHREYFQCTLQSLQLLYNQDNEIYKKISELIPLENYERLSTGWLKTLVRMLVNSNKWVQTRSAF